MKKLLHRTIVGLLTMTMLIQIAGMQPVQSVQARPDPYMQEIQESTPDPTVTQQPPIDTQPTIQPTIEPTAEATEEPLPTQPQEIQLSLQIEKNVYLPDETLQLIWLLEGDLLQEKETNLELEICVPAEIIPSAEVEKSFNWETGCTRLIITDPKGELGFKVTNQYFGIMSISGVVLRDGLAITGSALEFEVLNPDTLLEGPSIQMEQTAFLVKNGNIITTNLVIQGYGNFPDIKEMVLEICPMEAIQAVDEALIASRDAENPCYRKIVDQAEITLDWQLDKESTYKDTQLQLYLLADAVPVSYKEIDIYFEPSATITADRSQQVIETSDAPKITFPLEVATRAMDVTIKRASASEDPKILVGTVFRLNAFDAENGQEIKQFDAELVLELSYAGTDIAEDPGLYVWKYFHEGSQIWVSIRTEIDQENQIIRGYTNHFSDFALDPNDLFAAQIPSLSAADVAGFTGGASYEIPIQVPQGTGSFTPAVSLDYNSQAADQMNSNQQSSIVGLGWNLNAGAVITRNNQKNSNNTDDTFSITIGNISHDLIPIEKTSEYIAYTTKTANFDVIRRYTPSCSIWERRGYWVLWDKTGNIYRFEKTAVFDQTARDCGTINNTRSHAYAWYLSSVEDPSGLITKFTYYKKNYAEIVITQEIYLEDIVYPDGHTRIHFITEEGRTDYLWNWSGSKIPYNKRSLNQIQVLYDPSIQYDSNSGRVIVHGDETVISSYQLNYFDNTSNPIFPNIKWENVQGYKTGRYLALSSVVQKGKNGGEISQISFSYEDHQHLTKVENHAGASVEFTYESDPYYTENENISKQASKSTVGGLRYSTAVGYVRYTNS